MTYILLFILQDGPDSTNTAVQSSGVNWPAIGVVVAALGIFFMLCRVLIKFGIWSQRFENMDGNIASIASDIKKNTFTLKSVTTFLYTTGAAPGLFNTNSPTILSKLGEQIILESGGNAYIDDNIESLLERLQNMEYSSQLDIQNNAYFLLLGLTNESDMSTIKDFIFEHPVYLDIKLDMPTILKAMSIYLRDIMIDSVSFDSDSIPEE